MASPMTPGMPAPTNAAESVETTKVVEGDDEFRNYTDSTNTRQLQVQHHYRQMRLNQTVEFVLRMKERFAHLNNASMDVWEAFDVLDDFVDASDPDTDFPNIIHMLQTAESIRRAGEPDWMQLVGLIHDLGKLVHLFSNGAEDGQDGNGGEQWGIVGDTFIVGCALPECNVFPEFNSLNPDMKNPAYNTELGMYTPHCGLDALHCAFGHDEYLYMVLKATPDCTLPDAALDIVRYHSLYPWHKHGAYAALLAPGDAARLGPVQRFQKHDLYTKHSDPVDLAALKPYYEALVRKYLPGKLRW